jgi:hypothetical protein
MESKWIKLYIKTEKLSAENKWQQTQFNEKMGKYGKSKLKNIVKYNLLDLLVFHVTIVFIMGIIYIHLWPLIGQLRHFLMTLIQIGIYITNKCHVYLPNKMPKHRLIWWRNVGSLTFFVCRSQSDSRWMIMFTKYFLSKIPYVECRVSEYHQLWVSDYAYMGICRKDPAISGSYLS